MIIWQIPLVLPAFFRQQISTFLSATSPSSYCTMYLFLRSILESQSFLKPFWPGDYDNAIIMQLMSSDSVMTSRVQWRDRMHKKIVIWEMNLCVIGLFPSLEYFQSKVQRWFINSSNKGIYLVLVRDLLHSLEIVSGLFDGYSSLAGYY